MARDFEAWLDTFKPGIASYDYYVDFKKVVEHTEGVKIGLCVLNSLIGSKNIEDEFEKLATGKYASDVLKCIPILLAVRKSEICVLDEGGESVRFCFKGRNLPLEKCKTLMRKTGLFDMMVNHITNNLVDYVLGVETGLDSNGRKNRGGKLMENLVERYLVSAGLKKERTYFKEMDTTQIPRGWKIDLSSIVGDNKTKKRFDYVVHNDKGTFGMEVNFYTGGGSKLNEVARSYKMLALEAREVKGFKFVWVTDGPGWESAKNNLKETFDALDDLYCLADLENGAFERLFN